MYIVVEVQRNGDQVSNIATAYDNVNEAESKYYQILSFAAVSQVEYHSAFLLNDIGDEVKKHTYIHINISDGEHEPDQLDQIGEPDQPDEPDEPDEPDQLDE